MLVGRLKKWFSPNLLDRDARQVREKRKARGDRHIVKRLRRLNDIKTQRRRFQEANRYMDMREQEQISRVNRRALGIVIYHYHHGGIGDGVFEIGEIMDLQGVVFNYERGSFMI